jgi:glutaminyl-tRNA synthetase
MPTISGMRRRGYTPEAIKDFCERIGVAKKKSTVELALLEHCLREDLNKRALRVMAVLRPLKVTIDNYPEDMTEEFEIENNPEDPSAGTRILPFGRELFIEQDDFMEDAPKKFFRLAPGREVRLKGAFIIKCEKAIKDSKGNITELRCTYDPESRSGMPGADRKVKATIHWVSARHALKANVRLYDILFNDEHPEALDDFTSALNPGSLKELEECLLEPSMAEAKPGESYQFLRLGYFCPDSLDSMPGALVFNRTVSLRDDWARMKKSSK